MTSLYAFQPDVAPASNGPGNFRSGWKKTLYKTWQNPQKAPRASPTKKSDIGDIMLHKTAPYLSAVENIREGGT